MNAAMRAYYVLRHLGPQFAWQRVAITADRALGLTRRRFSPSPWESIHLYPILRDDFQTDTREYIAHKRASPPNFLFSLGRPMCTSDSQADTGALQHRGLAEALHQAMKAMVDDDALYADLCRGALLKRDLFDSDIWTERFVDHCKQLAGTPLDDHS